MTSRMLDHEWLPIAERLPVGSSVRVAHTCGKSPALVIYSTPGKLSAHCHRCKQWGSHNLEHRRPVAPLQERTNNRALPKQYIPLVELPQHLQDRVWRFIVSKNLDPGMLCIQDLLYSQEHDRLAIRIGQGQYLARSLGYAIPKWVQYSSDAMYQEYASFGPDACSTVVLTEDTLSAIKVHYVTKYRAVALLGTSLHSALTANLVQQFQAGVIQRLLVMLDGDSAGWDGTVRVYNELKFLGLPVQVVPVPKGMDPKDLSIYQIKVLLEV
jgi:hypothetical protein